MRAFLFDSDRAWARAGAIARKGKGQDTRGKELGLRAARGRRLTDTLITSVINMPRLSASHSWCSKFRISMSSPVGQLIPLRQSRKTPRRYRHNNGEIVHFHQPWHRGKPKYRVWAMVIAQHAKTESSPCFTQKPRRTMSDDECHLVSAAERGLAMVFTTLSTWVKSHASSRACEHASSRIGFNTSRAVGVIYLHISYRCVR